LLESCIVVACIRRWVATGRGRGMVEI